MTGPFKKLRATLAAPPDTFLVTKRSKRRVQSLIEKAGEGAVILNVGAGHTDYGRIANFAPLRLCEKLASHCLVSRKGAKFAKVPPWAEQLQLVNLF